MYEIVKHAGDVNATKNDPAKWDTWHILLKGKPFARCPGESQANDLLARLTAHRRYKCGYQSASRSWGNSPEAVTKIDKRYITWLVAKHGWTTLTLLCPKCRGHKVVMPIPPTWPVQLRKWKRARKAAGKPNYYTPDEEEACNNCKGTGRITLDKQQPDYEFAERYIKLQRETLAAYARKAVGEVEEKLHALGFRTLVTLYSGPMQLDTLEAYQQWETARSIADTAFHAASEEYTRLRDERKTAYEAIPEGTDFNDWTLINPQPSYSLVEDAQRALSAFGHKADGYWYRPGVQRVLWVGTRNARHFYGAPKPAVNLVITPGRKPSPEEIERITHEVVDEYDEVVADGLFEHEMENVA